MDNYEERIDPSYYMSASTGVSDRQQTIWHKDFRWGILELSEAVGVDARVLTAYADEFGADAWRAYCRGEKLSGSI